MSTPAPPVPVTAQAAKAADALATIVGVAQAAAPPAVPSPRFSFEGYSPWTWAVKHQELLKNVGKTETLILGIGGTAGEKVPVINGHVLLVAAIVAAIIPVSFAWDALQYFVKENPA